MIMKAPEQKRRSMFAGGSRRQSRRKQEMVEVKSRCLKNILNRTHFVFVFVFGFRFIFAFVFVFLFRFVVV